MQKEGEKEDHSKHVKSKTIFAAASVDDDDIRDAAKQESTQPTEDTNHQSTIRCTHCLMGRLKIYHHFISIRCPTVVFKMVRHIFLR